MLATDTGKVVVDSGAAAFGEAVRATLDELPGGRVTTLFNTHWHLDQVGSNEALRQRGRHDHRAREDALASHQRLLRPDRGSLRETAARSRAADQDAARQRHADRRRSTYRVRLSHRSAHRRRHLCGVPGRQRHRGRRRRVAGSATPCSIGSAAAGSADAWMRWRGCSSAAMPNTRFVPSYGPVLRRADVQAEHDMMLALFEIMVEHVRLGESSEDILETGVLGRPGAQVRGSGEVSVRRPQRLLGASQQADARYRLARQS